MSCHIDVEDVACGYGTRLQGTDASDDDTWTCGQHHPDTDALLTYGGAEWTGSMAPPLDTLVTLTQSLDDQGAGSNSSAYDPIVTRGDCGVVDVAQCPAGPFPNVRVQPPARIESVQFTADGVSTYYLTVEALYGDVHPTDITVDCVLRYVDDRAIVGPLSCDFPRDVSGDAASDTLDQYTCGSDPIDAPDAERVYTFTAPESGHFEASFAGESGEQNLFVVPASRRTAECVDADTSEGASGSIGFDLAAGSTAYVVVEGGGAGILTMDCGEEPDTDVEPEDTDVPDTDVTIDGQNGVRRTFWGCSSTSGPPLGLGITVLALFGLGRRARAC